MERSMLDNKTILVTGGTGSFGNKVLELFLDSDLKEYYDPKTLFNQITGDLEFEKKGENVKTIPFELSPKIGITANFVVKDLINDSSKRRFVPFELDKFFSAKNTIFDFFGNDFFCKDWDEKEWSRFDTFAVRCIQLFLNEGVLEENSETFEIKAILENCGHLKNFAEEYIIPKNNLFFLLFLQS